MKKLMYLMGIFVLFFMIGLIGCKELTEMAPLVMFDDIWPVDQELEAGEETLISVGVSCDDGDTRITITAEARDGGTISPGTWSMRRGTTSFKFNSEGIIVAPGKRGIFRNTFNAGTAEYENLDTAMLFIYVTSLGEVSGVACFRGIRDVDFILSMPPKESLEFLKKR